MSTLVVDDHLLADVIADMTPRALAVLLDRNEIATTNLYYYRLCRAALEAPGGAMTGSWSTERRKQAVGALVQLSPDIDILPMQDLAFRMAELARAYRLSALGAEAIAATELSGGWLCVWEGDIGPNMKACCEDVGLRYEPIGRE